MTEQTITFTPQAELRKGLRCLARGTVLTIRSLLRMADSWAHRYPWAFILAAVGVSVVTSLVCIGRARAERDALNKRAYLLQQKVDNYEMADEARREVAYGRRSH